MGLDTLQGRRDKNKLKWWYKLSGIAQAIGIRRSFLIRNGILSHGCWSSLMISFRH